MVVPVNISANVKWGFITEHKVVQKVLIVYDHKITEQSLMSGIILVVQSVKHSSIKRKKF